MAGFDDFGISFASTEIAVDWNGLSYVDGKRVQIAFTLKPIPEAVSGAVLGLVHTEWATQLLTTDYGHALIVKIVIVGGAAIAAYLARRRAELAIAAVAIGAASLVAALPPPF